MNLVTKTLRWQRIAVATAVVASALLFWRGTYDVFNTFKGTLIVLCALVAAGVGAYRWSRTRRVELPVTPAVYAAGALALALVVATLVALDPMEALVGRPGRHTGLVMYLTYLGLFVLCTRLYRDHAPSGLVKALIGASIPIAGYGLLQSIGVDPYNWQLVEGGPPVFSTFGNANFFAAFLGVCVPLCVWGALTRTWSIAWRVGSGVVGVATLAAAFVSESLQGPAIAVIGSGLVLGTWVASHERLSRMVKLVLFGVGAAVVVGGAFLMVTGAGPFGSLGFGFSRSLGTRTPKWVTALDIWRANPIVGVGLEGFADYFHEFRPTSLAVETGLRRTTDTPHNIPLDMLANGGLVLAVPYLAFVGLTGWSLVRGLMRNAGEDRLLLAAVGGGWLAYQVQSLVSIDVPPIAVLHYVLAGAVVGLGARPALRELKLPGAREAKAKGKKGRNAAPRAVLAPHSPAVVGVLALGGLVGAFLATTPVRADAHAATAQLVGASQLDAAVGEYERAASIAFWESRYYSLEGQLLTRPGVDRGEQALAAQLRAVEREPRSLANLINAARLSASLGQMEEASRLWERVLEVDPKTPEVLVDVGRFFLSAGELERAGELLQYVVEARPDEAPYWVAFGELREAQEDAAAAKEAYERAVELDPEVAGGQARLDRVSTVA